MNDNTEVVIKNESTTLVKEDSKIKTYYIYFEPESDIFKDGTNPLFLLDELHTLGNCKVFAHFNKIPEIKKLDITDLDLKLMLAR